MLQLVHCSHGNPGINFLVWSCVVLSLVCFLLQLANLHSYFKTNFHCIAHWKDVQCLSLWQVKWSSYVFLIYSIRETPVLHTRAASFYHQQLAKYLVIKHQLNVRKCEKLFIRHHCDQHCVDRHTKVFLFFEGIAFVFLMENPLSLRHLTNESHFSCNEIFLILPSLCSWRKAPCQKFLCYSLWAIVMDSWLVFQHT